MMRHATSTWCCVIASGLLLVSSCLSFPWFSTHFGHLILSFLEWNLEVFPYSDLVKFGVYGNLALSSFQQDWFCAIWSSLQETTAPGSKALKLISLTSIVFPNFPMKISRMLSANWENQVVDKVVIFEKVFAFWISLVRTRKILCTKVVCWIVVVGKFPAFELVFAIFPTSGWPNSRCRI